MYISNKWIKENLKQIARLMLDELKFALLKEKNINFGYDDKLVDFLVTPLENGKYGARDLKKEIHDKIEKFIVNLILSARNFEKVSVSAIEGDVVFY